MTGITILFTLEIYAQLSSRSSSFTTNYRSSFIEASENLEMSTPYFKYSSHKTDQLVRVLINDGHTPKHFIDTFLNSQDKVIRDHRKMWNVERGLPSTLTVVKGLRNIFLETQEGHASWRGFILDEVGQGCCG